MTYPEQLKTEEWKLKRQERFRVDGFECVFCGSKKEIQCHHKAYNRNGFIWEVPLEWLETLCRECHERRTEIEREIRMMPARDFFNWWENKLIEQSERFQIAISERADELESESSQEAVSLKSRLREVSQLLEMAEDQLEELGYTRVEME